MVSTAQEFTMDYSIPIAYTLSIHKVHKYLNWGFVHLVGMWLSAISLNVCTVGEGPTCKTLEVPPGKMHLTRVDITASVSCKSKTQTDLMANICILKHQSLDHRKFISPGRLRLSCKASDSQGAVKLATCGIAAETYCWERILK